MSGHIAPTRTVGPAVARYFARNLRHTKGPKAGQAFVLEPWQRADLDLIYEVDANHRRVWRSVLYGQARGNGKTPTVAGIGLVELESRKDSPDIFCAAGAREQAGILLEFARDFVEIGPLRRRLTVQRSLIRSPRNRGSMRVLSADGSLQHGRSVSVAVIDEWHAFVTDKQRELYYALATALHKRADSLEFAITTAGFDKTTQLGERYQQLMRAPSVEQFGCTIVCRDPETRSLMIWRGAPEGADIDDPAVWRACNPASWLETAELAIQRKRLPENVFRRLHLNQWTAAESAWLPAGGWKTCTRTGLVIPDGAEVYLGVDIGMKKDSSAVVKAWPHAG